MQACRRFGYYPDLFVICGEDKLREGRNEVILNPLLTVEVLSAKTRSGTAAIVSALPTHSVLPRILARFSGQIPG